MTKDKNELINNGRSSHGIKLYIKGYNKIVFYIIQLKCGIFKLMFVLLCLLVLTYLSCILAIINSIQGIFYISNVLGFINLQLEKRFLRVI